VVNWTSYNESLVRRGEVILDFDIIDGWYVELERMNKGKRGATYSYPNSFVQLLGYELLIAQLDPRRIDRPDVQSLLRKVELRPDDGFTVRSPPRV
jgi:2-methylcitrate dehydratase PrpD